MAGRHLARVLKIELIIRFFFVLMVKKLLFSSSFNHSIALLTSETKLLGFEWVWKREKNFLSERRMKARGYIICFHSFMSLFLLRWINILKVMLKTWASVHFLELCIWYKPLWQNNYVVSFFLRNLETLKLM